MVSSGSRENKRCPKAKKQKEKVWKNTDKCSEKKR
jgi:hypothetical protein